MVKARAVVTAKVKKKAWHTIIAPKEQNNVLLGETYVSEPQVAIGKTVHANLRTITDNMRDQSVYLKFKITQLAGQNLQTEVTGYYMTPPSLRKLTRRSSLRIDDSFVVSTKDDKKVRIKPIAVTRNDTVHSIGTTIRREMQNFIAREVAKIDFKELIIMLMSHQLQGAAKKKLSKIYPLRALEIKVLEFAKEGKTVKATEEEGEAEEKPMKKRERKKKKTVSEEMMEEFASEGEKKDAEKETIGEEEQAPGI